VADAVRHVDAAGTDGDGGDTADRTDSEPRADTRSGRGIAVDADESVGNADNEDPTVMRAGGDADDAVGNVGVADDAGTPVEDEGKTVSDEVDDADPVRKNQPADDPAIKEAQPTDDTYPADKSLVGDPDTELERDSVAGEGAPMSDGEIEPADSQNGEAETTDVVRDDGTETGATDVGRGADADADADIDGTTETVGDGDGTPEKSDGADREFTASASESKSKSESTRSAAKRFIDRAVGIVGREDD
jgi:hypothetical protein